jgi:hypothetical protein
MMDLYVGYNERTLAASSRDYTTFQTPYGALQLTTLPMGWTNSMPIFHNNVTHILQPEISCVTQPYSTMNEILRWNILQLQNNTLHTGNHHFRT